MAFIHQRRRPVQRLQETNSYSDDAIPSVSDSDNDWHVISSTLTSASNSSVQSVSETESVCSSYKPFSDTDDSFSDIDHLLEATLGALPSHDGTGTFTARQDSLSPSPSESHVMPEFVPTLSGIRSQELIQRGSDKITLVPTPQDLDSIPIHHPAGTTTILSIVWSSLARLKDNWIENEASTLERLSAIMSEAILEGCMPFSSPLHMERSLLEGKYLLSA
ncbi:hypothetical protein BY458DRAFT_517016 [Sporodiniella umbellata]|nr:hypothetical protein BY458DRAFT_517016 [Sporodiniella umbellata]